MRVRSGRRTVGQDMAPGRDDPGSSIPWNRWRAVPVGFLGGRSGNWPRGCRRRGRRGAERESGRGVLRVVPVVGDALHLEAEIVHERFDRRPPSPEVRSRHLQRRDAAVADVGGVGEPDRVQVGAGSLQGGEAAVDRRVASGTVAVQIGEAPLPLLVLFVEPAIELVEDHLQVGIHGTLSAAEPGEVLVRLRRRGIQIGLV